MSRRVRSTSLFVVLATASVLMGLTAPGAQAEGDDLHVEIVNQPTDAGVGDLITAEAFDPTGGESGFVQVHVSHTVWVCDYESDSCWEEEQDLQYAEVTFVLPEGSPSNDLSVEPRFTNSDGIATFGPVDGSENPLSIGTANDPSTTEYRLIPVATFEDDGEGDSYWTESAEGEPSDPFDIWDEGCEGTGCSVTVRGGNDTYTAGSDVGLGVSVVPAGSSEITCPNQRLIFASSVFVHTTTGDGTDIVSLVTHITRADLLAAPSSGKQKIGWCLGIKSAAPWMRNGAQFQTQVVDGQTWYVAMAPPCPKRGSAADFAPCIFSITSDGAGGNIFRGYVLGGDPPRRT